MHEDFEWHGKAVYTLWYIKYCSDILNITFMSLKANRMLEYSHRVVTI